MMGKIIARGTAPPGKCISIEHGRNSSWQGVDPGWRGADRLAPPKLTIFWVAGGRQAQAGQRSPCMRLAARLQDRQAGWLAARGASSDLTRRRRTHRSRTSTAAKPSAPLCAAAHLPTAAPRTSSSPPCVLQEHRIHASSLQRRAGGPQRKDDQNSSASRATPGRSWLGGEPSQKGTLLH